MLYLSFLSLSFLWCYLIFVSIFVYHVKLIGYDIKLLLYLVATTLVKRKLSLQGKNQIYKIRLSLKCHVNNISLFSSFFFIKGSHLDVLLGIIVVLLAKRALIFDEQKIGLVN